MFARLSAVALPLALILAPPPALAQKFEVSIIESETVMKGRLNKCHYVVEAKNVGGTASQLSLVTEHRLTEGTMSAMVTPKNGAFGSIKVTGFREIPPGESATRKGSFLGADCKDFDAIWFEPDCGADCLTTAADSSLPIKIATAEDLAARSDPDAANLLDGIWIIETSDGKHVATMKALQPNLSRKVTGTVSITDAFCALYGDAGCAAGMGAEGKILLVTGEARKSVYIQFGDSRETQIQITWEKNGVGRAVFERTTTPLTVERKAK